MKVVRFTFRFGAQIGDSRPRAFYRREGSFFVAKLVSLCDGPHIAELVFGGERQKLVRFELWQGGVGFEEIACCLVTAETFVSMRQSKEPPVVVDLRVCVV